MLGEWGCLQPSGEGKRLCSPYLGLPGEIRTKLSLASPQCSHRAQHSPACFPTRGLLGGFSEKGQLCLASVCCATKQAGRGRESALHRTLISQCSGSQQSGGRNSQLHSSSELCIGSQKSQTCATPPCCPPCRKRQARRLHRWARGSSCALSVGAAFPLSSSPTVQSLTGALHSVFQENRGSLKVTAGCSPQTPPWTQTQQRSLSSSWRPK